MSTDFKRLLCLLAIFLCLFVGVNEYVEYLNKCSGRRMVAKVKAAYLQAAKKGEVPMPADSATSLVVHARCSYSQPREVEVITTDGHKFHFFAENNGPYQFKLGWSSTNAPSYKLK